MRPSKWKLALYAVVIVLGCLIVAPNVMTDAQLAHLPSWAPHKRMTLGLDIRGGSHLVLQVDEPALKKERLESLQESLRASFREKGVSGASVRQDGEAIEIKIREGAPKDKIRETVNDIGKSSGLFGHTGAALDVKEIPDGFTVNISEAAAQEFIDAAVTQSLEIVRRRIDEVGVAEPGIQRLGRDRIVVQLPGVQDPDAIRNLLGSTAKLSFHMVRGGGDMPRSVQTMRLPDAKGNGEYYTVDRIPLLQGDRLENAMPGYDQQTGQPIISFRLDDIGARRFGDVTRQNVGKPFAIVLDGKILSAPVIREPIPSGSGQISGHFTTAETTSLSALLRAGALPAPLHVIEERTVGPDLGKDAIRMGGMMGLAGFGLVIVFITMLYGRWGMVANLALIANVVLTFAALTLLGATLTLPGVAGVVLGIGIAVDANVLINERIREETRLGKPARHALELGFKHAYSTIVDSNVTTLIATTLLFFFGSGPVKGFAVTMGLGIAISMFTAVTVVKAIMGAWVDAKRPKQFIITPLFGMQIFSDHSSIKFMKARFFGIGVSMVLSVASIILFIKPGLNYGIDFVGGTLIEAHTQRPANLANIRNALEGAELGEAAVQEFGDPTAFLIRLERQKGTDSAAVADAAKKILIKAEPDATVVRTETVGPKLSDELAYMGIVSVTLASLAMMAYIWMRFEWQFAIGAIATLVLDVTKTVGFFALTQLDFNLTAIAALLTLIGYSVNDKVVVYDRMRENLRLNKKTTLREVIDVSINATLKRSIYTSATAMLAMLPMAIAGGEAVKSFAIPMTFGIVIATSSSIFIAAPILLYFGEKMEKQGRGYFKPAPN
ncbi:MAG: protein translocase subunit SecD [Rickettsiales bacterium]